MTTGFGLYILPYSTISWPALLNTQPSTMTLRKLVGRISNGTCQTGLSGAICPSSGESVWSDALIWPTDGSGYLVTSVSRALILLPGIFWNLSPRILLLHTYWFVCGRWKESKDKQLTRKISYRCIDGCTVYWVMYEVYVKQLCVFLHYFWWYQRFRKQ